MAMRKGEIIRRLEAECAAQGKSGAERKAGAVSIPFDAGRQDGGEVQAKRTASSGLPVRIRDSISVQNVPAGMGHVA